MSYIPTIVVVGASGDGKSYLIRSMTDDVKIISSTTMEKCTRKPKKAYMSNGVALIDTEGFDMPDNDNKEIVNNLMNWIHERLSGHKVIAIFFTCSLEASKTPTCIKTSLHTIKSKCLANVPIHIIFTKYHPGLIRHDERKQELLSVVFKQIGHFSHFRYENDSSMKDFIGDIVKGEREHPLEDLFKKERILAKSDLRKLMIKQLSGGIDSFETKLDQYESISGGLMPIEEVRHIINFVLKPILERFKGIKIDE
jgi:GTP-binding protein EngB required for normal cell division